MRAASPAAPQSAPAWAWGLTAALRGFLASGDGSGVGGRERASEGSWVGALSHLGQVSFSDPLRPSGLRWFPQIQARALDPLPSWRRRGFEQPGYAHEVPGSSSWVQGDIEVNGTHEMGDSSFDRKNSNSMLRIWTPCSNWCPSIPKGLVACYLLAV